MYTSYDTKKKSRREINAPCAFMSWNEVAQRDEVRFPSYSCDLDCSKCGWNPVVAEGRNAKLGKRKIRWHIRKGIQCPTDHWGVPAWEPVWKYDL